MTLLVTVMKAAWRKWPLLTDVQIFIDGNDEEASDIDRNDDIHWALCIITVLLFIIQ